MRKPDRFSLYILSFYAAALLFSLWPAVASGQEYPLREYGVVDGLPQSQVHSITQDSRGFLWIVTKNGLSRFDGIDFVNYGRKDGLPSNVLIRVLEYDNRIWAVSNEGVSEYTGTSFKFYKPPQEYASMLFGSAEVFDDCILMICHRARGKPGKLVRFSKGIYSSYSDESGLLDSLDLRYIISDKSSACLLLHDLSGCVYILRNRVLHKAIGKTYDDLLRIGDRGFAIIDDEFYRPVGNVLERDTSVYSGTEISVRDTGPLSGIRINTGASSADIYLPVHMVGYFVDRENMLWLATESNMFRLNSMAFSSFSDEDIGILNIWSLGCDVNGHLWLGSLNGDLVEYDGNRFIEHDEHLRLFGKVPSFYKGTRQLSDGSVLFATNMGILKWDGRMFSRVRAVADNAQVCYIYEDPADGSVFAGTDIGLYLLGKENTRFYSRDEYPGIGVVEGMTRLDDGTYLLSGHNGLVAFDLRMAVPETDSILPEGFTFTIAKDNKGGAWITSEEGLFFRDPRTGTYRQGLPEGSNKPANSILLMDSIHLMVGRGSDICIIDLEKFYSGKVSYFRVYDKTDGFEGSDCIDNGIIRDAKGRFWILTANRLVRFDPGNLKVNRKPPILNITGVYYQDDSLLWKRAADGNLFYEIPRQLQIPAGTSKLRIAFTGISTTNPEKVRYRYRLAGLSDEWSDPSGERDVVYENIPPGNYTFELWAENADGFDTTIPLVLPVRIMPALWQTLAFRISALLVSVVLVIALTYIYLNRRQNSIRAAEELRKELSNLQISSVLKQFDPHFTFNVINSVGALIMEGKRDTAYDYITKLSLLLRRAFREGALVVRPVSDEIDFVSQYCELQKLRFNDRFNYSLNVSPAVDTGRLVPRMLIQIFVENAVKHGFGDRPEGGKVEIELLKENDALLILVRDDGVGRQYSTGKPVSDPGSGIMLVSSIFRIMNERNSLKSNLETKDLFTEGLPSGTEVRILIPDGYDFSFA